MSNSDSDQLTPDESVQKKKRGRPPKHKGLFMAIDLGNGTTLIAFVNALGQIVVLADREGLMCTPTAIAFEDGDPDKPLFGRTAMNYRRVCPEFCCVMMKRARGQGEVPGIVDKNGRVWSVAELESVFVQSRLRHVEEVTGESIAGVLVCVPACFNDQQRRASLEVVEQATFRPLGTINEPSAAVIAVAKGKNGVYVIVDIGAGTTDVSVVRSEDDGHTITILATAGRDDRGGREVTSRIVEYCLDYASQHGVALDPEEDSRDIVIIESEAETCKQDLSSRDSVTLTIRAKDKLLDIPLTLSAFNQLIADLCQDILALVDEALSQAQITPDEVDGVASVGGGSRVRYLRENIEVKFGSAKAMKDFDVDKCVVMGAVDAIAIKVQERIAVGDVALQGMAPEYQLKGNVVLREVLGQALGVLAVNTRTMREQLAAMIPQGTALPATASTTFGLIGGAEGVDSADIVVLQGKANCDPSDATELARFPLHDLPAGPTDERVRVELDVDTSALASVRAVDTFSGKEIQGQAHTAAAVTKSHLG